MKKSLLILALSITNSCYSQQLGKISKSVTSQVDVFEVLGVGVQPTDIVQISRGGQPLGEATVTRISSGAFTISLKRHFDARVSDDVMFLRHAELSGAQAEEPYTQVRKTGDFNINSTYFVDNRNTAKIDRDTVRFRIKIQARSGDMPRSSALNNDSYGYWLMHRNASYECAKEIEPTAGTYLKGSTEPLIDDWTKTKPIARGTLEDTLYRLAFPDENP